MPQNKYRQYEQMQGATGWHQDYSGANQFQQQMSYAQGLHDQAYFPGTHGTNVAGHQHNIHQMNQQQQQMHAYAAPYGTQAQGQQSQGQQQKQQQQKQQIQQQYQGQYSQLSTKDFNYLKDHMSWELLAAKKCAHFAQECQNAQIAELINQVGQMHERHYNTLLQYVNPQTVQ